MYVFLTVLIVIAAILLTLLVLVQNSKGGGLANGFAGGNQVMGAPRTANFLEKATWTLVIFIAVLAVATAGFNTGKDKTGGESEVVVENTQQVNQPLGDTLQVGQTTATTQPQAKMPVETPAEAPAAE